jgi:hypothetical protein
VRGSVEACAVVPNSLTDVVERLYRDFGGGVDLHTVIAVVNQCRDELDTHSHHALPELVERLARHRLTELTQQPQ